MKTFYRHIFNYLLALLSVTAIAQGNTTTGPNGEISTSFSEATTLEGEPNEVMAFDITFFANIPDVEINGEFFMINFAEVMLQVHEVNESNVNNPNDVPEQKIIFQSNMTQIFNGTSRVIFNVRMPSVLSSELPPETTYRLRMKNTGVGTVDASVIPLELTVTLGGTLSATEVLENSPTYLASPNPTEGYVEFVKNIEQVQVFDIYGKLLLTTNNTESINLESFSSGMYFITIQDSTATETFKIIKD